MAGVIGTHVISPIGGPVVHVPPNGQPSFSDNAVYIDIYEMGYYGSQSANFSGGVIGPSTNAVVTGLGTADDGPAINSAIAALAGSGRILCFPAGIFKITTAIVNTSGVQMQIGPLAQFTGTNAFTMASASGGAATGNNLPGYVRGVFTTVTTSTTYTGTTTNTLTFGTNAIMGAQDGITLAVGDCFHLPGGTLGACAITACDIGPWIISVKGTASTKCVLTRPTWWQTGSVVPQLYQFTVGPEGSVFYGGKWTAWGTTSAAQILIGATGTDPLFYPDHVATLVTLSSGFVTQTTVPVRSTTLTSFSYMSASYSGGSTTAKFTTGAIGSGGAATAAGYNGTGSVSITALAVGGTVVAGDVSTGWLHIYNRQ
jgi:hypothetical protein